MTSSVSASSNPKMSFAKNSESMTSGISLSASSPIKRSNASVIYITS